MSAAAPRRVFVYGTLQFPRIARAVTGRDLPRQAACLDGYARFQVKGEPFPGILPWPGASVEGVLLDGIDAAVVARLDDFEGAMYRRQDVEVRPLGGGADAAAEALAAQAYVVRPRWRSLLAHDDWDAETFRRRWHDFYLRTGRAGGGP